MFSRKQVLQNLKMKNIKKAAWKLQSKLVYGKTKTERWGQKAEATWGRKILKLKRIALRSKNRKIQKLKLKTNMTY